MPYYDRECPSCHALFTPTSGRQITCTNLDCQIWWAEQPREGETPEETQKKGIQRVAQVRSRAKHPPTDEEREANREYMVQWRLDNPEKAKEIDLASKAKRRERDLEGARRSERLKRRRQRAADPDKAREDARKSSRKRYSEKPEVVRAEMAAWRAKHRDELLERSKQWRRDNPDKARAIWARRAARKKGADIVETVNRLVVAERDNWICQLCGDPIDPDAPYRLPDGKNNPEYLNIDHIMPLARGGEHSYANSQAAHARCNNRKNAKLPDEFDADAA